MTDEQLPEILGSASDTPLPPGTPRLIMADFIGGPFEGRRPAMNEHDGYPGDILTGHQDGEPAVYVLEAQATDEGPAWAYRYDPDKTAERKALNRRLKEQQQ